MVPMPTKGTQTAGITWPQPSPWMTGWLSSKCTSLAIADRIVTVTCCVHPQDSCRIAHSSCLHPEVSPPRTLPPSPEGSHGATAARAPGNSELWQSKFWSEAGGRSPSANQHSCHPEEHAQELDKAHVPAQIQAFHRKCPLKRCSQESVGHARTGGCCSHSSRTAMGFNCLNQTHPGPPSWHPCSDTYGHRGTGEKGN